MIDQAKKEKIQILAVGSDRSCKALERAEEAGIPCFTVEYRAGETDRAQWNRELVEKLESYAPDLVVSAGFMRIIGEEVINKFPRQIINTHPALLPAFPGAHAVEDAINYGVAVTGTTVHVVDTGVDTGPIIDQRAVRVQADDTVESLHERIKQMERELLVDVLHGIADHGLTIDGRKARIDND